MTCFELTASPIELEYFKNFDQLIRHGKCKYCGAPAVGGCGGLSIPGVIEQPLDIWCEACRLDLVEFNRQPENKIPDFPFDDEAAQARVSEQMDQRARRQEEFMRRRIKDRSR